MFKTIALTTGLFLSSIFVPQASAYSYGAYEYDIGAATITEALEGEHPYEKREREEDLRKAQQRAYKQSFAYRSDSVVYGHPIFAKRSVLHPFFRKGGVSNYFEGRYASWRGYQDPALARNLSPDAHCTNYVYEKLSHGSQPSGYQCF